MLNRLGRTVIEKTLETMSKAKSGREYVADATNTVNVIIKGESARSLLKSGNVVQLFSRSSERMVQIVCSTVSNELACDAIGGFGASYTNAHWTVICQGSSGRCYFYNQFNYLSMKNGEPMIIRSSSGENPPIEAAFIIRDVFGSSHAVYLESAQTLDYVLSFDTTGYPLMKRRFRINDRFAQFEIKFIHSTVEENTSKPAEDSDLPSYEQATSQTKAD